LQVVTQRYYLAWPRLARRLFASAIPQPHDFDSPLRSDQPATTTVAPQSHLHVHIAKRLPDRLIFDPANSTTTNRPQRRPVMSMTRGSRWDMVGAYAATADIQNGRQRPILAQSPDRGFD
jgi:hypothetical protein